MRILITTEFYYPFAGGSIFLQNVAEGLVKRGHQVTVATTRLRERAAGDINGVKIKEFDISGNVVKGIRGEADAYKQFLKNFGADVMINFAANIWTTDLAFEVLDELQCKKILTTPGLSKLYQKRYHQYNYETYLNAAKKYDKIVYTSFEYRDKIFGDQHGLGDKAVLIPNGAGDEFSAKGGQVRSFRERYGIQTKRMIVSISNHFIAKGHWFVILAFLLMRRRDTTLVIIGQKPHYRRWYTCYPLCRLMAALSPRIKTLTNVPRIDTVAAFQEADLYLFGSFIECSPLVMYESFASKTPFVSRPVGNVTDYRGLVTIVQSPGQMARESNRLLDDETERSRLAQAGFKLWQEKYTWDKIIDTYDRLCRSTNI